MSQTEADELTAQVVTEYLKDNPDFFLHRQDLVEHLSLPSQEQGAVSLVHVQMTRQRQRIEDLEEEITALMSLAADNDKTFHEFMQLQEQILKCHDLFSAIQCIENKAHSLDLQAYIRLIDVEEPLYQFSQVSYQKFANQHLNGKDAFLGRLRKSDRQALLGELGSTPDLGSYVVLPLLRKQVLGLLIFSSDDGGHFQPSMDTLFLRHLALVFSHLVETLPWNSVGGDNDQLSNGSS
ncbi:DUF484 family protein [Vibrio sp. S4M6]|uniref:DUF484 family protein n=1 Tax=Vibrio sinus TaxID=2946865 RepID=UPI00202A78DF|nr:DUF484 family protein [Vibrio sinus]MCL9783550.1 DUF484 family protein [Vibrio sinus]